MSDRDRGELTKARLIGGGLIIAVLFAVGFIGWGLWKSAEYERQADAHSRHYAAYTDQQIGQTCLRAAPVEQQQCIEEARHKQREDERYERDLVAQRQSALWAYIMGAAAVIGMGLSVVGVVLVWTTFAETRRANEIAEESLATQLRPWICPLGVDHIFANEIEDETGQQGSGVLFRVLWKNQGQSPAVHCRLAAGIRVLDPDEVMPLFNIPVAENGSVQGPQALVLGSYKPVMGDDFNQFQMGHKHIAVYGCIYYLDSIRGVIERKSEACYRIIYNGHQVNEKTGEVRPNFDVRIEGPQNTTT